MNVCSWTKNSFKLNFFYSIMHFIITDKIPECLFKASSRWRLLRRRSSNSCFMISSSRFLISSVSRLTWKKEMVSSSPIRYYKNISWLTTTINQSINLYAWTQNRLCLVKSKLLQYSIVRDITNIVFYTCFMHVNYQLIHLNAHPLYKGRHTSDH